MTLQSPARRRQLKLAAASAAALAATPGARGAPIHRPDGLPRKRYLSAASQEAVFRAYFQAVSQHIEEFGTRHYPTGLEGAVSLSLTIDTEGRVLAGEIVPGSGDRLLGERALAIARSAAPFARFGDAMRRNTDQVVATLHYRFDAGSSADPRVSAMP